MNIMVVAKSSALRLQVVSAAWFLRIRLGTKHVDSSLKSIDTVYRTIPA